MAAERQPPGWDHNPARWNQRLPIVVIALVGLGAAGRLALHQEGVTATVGEPFFGGGPREIVGESGFPRSFERSPIGDASTTRPARCAWCRRRRRWR